MSPGARFCPSCGLSLEKKNGTKSEIAGYDKDKKTIAGILAILLGGIGVHYFYLGKTTAGLITILLTCCTCGFWDSCLRLSTADFPATPGAAASGSC